MIMTEVFNPFSLSGKTILVTGASSGIGRGIAEACAKMGATIVLTGRNEERLAATAEALVGNGHKSIIVDLALIGERQILVNQLPALDGVVYAAGIGQRQLCKLITENDVDEVMDINFKSIALLQAELLRAKKIKKASSIVFIASRAAFSPSIGNAIYSASKGALISYAKCLALELASRQIRVNCICPAMVWTDLILKGGLTKEDLQEAEQQYPLKRYGQPEDVANLVIYLLSEASAWMTGTNVDLTGGESNL